MSRLDSLLLSRSWLQMRVMPALLMRCRDVFVSMLPHVQVVLFHQ